MWPLALVYGLVTGLRNWMYDREFFRSVKFDFPVIAVGNLTVGGTGKTPHVEYLIALLQYLNKVATLSRGYGRKTHGFLVASPQTTAKDIGDEPRLFKAKFPDTIVSVGEERMLAIPKLLTQHPETDVIILDDAFQHRAVRAGLSILLTEYDNLFTRDNIMPVGWLREGKSGYHRADMIVVTKCPPDISLQEREKIKQELKPYKYQRVYFSSIQYAPLYSFYNFNQKVELNKDVTALLVCGIANYKPLQQHLENTGAKVYVREFRDHHQFDSFDLDSIRQTYENFGDIPKVMVITEKDATRMEGFGDWFLQNKIRIFVQPITVKFIGEDEERFNRDIFSYVEFAKAKMTAHMQGNPADLN